MVEEEDLSELQLRLLALQSASKKWHQKEQQVMKRSRERITKVAQDGSSSSAPADSTPIRQRVTTRAAAAAAATATERNRTRSKPLNRERDRTKLGARPADRDRLKQSPKPGPKALLERGRAAGKVHTTKKMITPGEKGLDLHPSPGSGV